MGLYESERRPDGTSIVGDDENPNVSVILKAGQWAEIAGLPDSEQRHRLREFLAMNRAGPDPRSEAEQNQVDAASQGQGERHETQEESQ